MCQTSKHVSVISMCTITDEELDDIPPIKLALEDSELSGVMKLRRKIEYALLTLA